jgi:hypothetical protein
VKTSPLDARQLAYILYQELTAQQIGDIDPDYFRAVADGEYDVNNKYCGVTPLLRALESVVTTVDWKKQ